MLPVIRIDVFFLSGLLGAFLVAGYLLAVWRTRRNVSPKTVWDDDLDRGALIRLMSRSDHLMDNYASSILGNISEVEGDLLLGEERWLRARDNIISSAESMKRQIQRLRLVRLGLDPNALTLSPVNLGRLIPNVLAVLEPLATDKDITLLMEQSQAVPPVLGDPHMLEEVFTTLVDNAIKHNQPKTKIVAEIGSSDGMATIRISDNGSGIRPEKVDRIFEAGVREGGAAASAGTGMGLYIAKLLAESQGGDISAESELGKGSVFTVKLPTAQNRDED